jgi:hypothetical protein
MFLMVNGHPRDAQDVVLRGRSLKRLRNKPEVKVCEKEPKFIGVTIVVI